MSGLVINTDTGCVEWTRAKKSGYGTIRFDGRQQSVHRVMYELFAGPVPEGADLDHLCRNRACANVSHLEPVTRKENLNRGVNWQREKMTAPCGHPYDSLEAGARRCSKCRRKARWGDKYRRKSRRKGEQP